jgi:RimJ/RimL family protein N-acetyltransferase
MKIDEPFNPDIKSISLQDNIHFELAEEKHVDSICKMMAERNPLEKIEEIKKKTEREISLNKNDPEYRLFVAVIEDEVVGLCRFYHSRGLPKEKIKFASPDGWYAMGTLVSEQHRRKSIAKFLFQERLKILKSFNASALYSIVDITNKTSIRMHQEFGFIEESRAKGFLHLDFQNSEAILFKFDIK